MSRLRNGDDSSFKLHLRIANLEDQHEEDLKRIALLEARLRQNGLTGLTNGYGFEEIKEKLEAFVAEHSFTGQGCFVGIDLDGFKGVNDNHGHDVGDLVLKHFAKKLKEKVAEREIHAPNRVPILAEPIHPHGDEYGILIVEAVATDVRSKTEPDRRSSKRKSKKDRRGNPNRLRIEIEGLMEEIIRDLQENPLQIDGENGPKQVAHGVSFGIGMFTSPDIESIRTAEKEADEKMYEAKRATREEQADLLFLVESGQEAFHRCLENMDPQTREFAEEIVGVRIETDKSWRGRTIPDNDLGLSAYYTDSRFPQLMTALDENAMRWVFPELLNKMAQSTPEFSR